MSRPSTREPATPERAKLHQFIARHHKFLLTTHINPDGDAIGSEVTFARLLRALGKSVRVLNDSPTPHAFGWLGAVAVPPKVSVTGNTPWVPHSAGTGDDSAMLIIAGT